MPVQWRAVIIEGFTGNPKADGLSCVELEEVLHMLTAEGWQIRFVLPNGVNRWTVIAQREEAI